MKLFTHYSFTLFVLLKRKAYAYLIFGSKD